MEINNKNSLSWDQIILHIQNNLNYKDLVKSCYYDDPIENAAQRFYESKEWLNISNLFKKKGKIIDIGAGRGISLYAFAKDGWSTYAIDPNDGNVSGLKAIQKLFLNSNLRAELKKTTSENIMFNSNHFDLVYTRQSLHHCNNLVLTCAEISRVLKPGGFFFATREHVINNREELDVFLEKHPLQKFTKKENAFTLKEYTAAIKSSGLKILKIFKTYDTEINYDPKSLDEIIDHYMKNWPIIENVYKKINRSQFLPLKIIIKKLLIKFLNFKNDKIPGRPYSFLAIKKFK